MRKSEELINEKIFKAGVIGSNVKFEKAKESRRITVNGADAFVQMRDDERGTFTGEFNDLMLP